MVECVFREYHIYTETLTFPVDSTVIKHSIQWVDSLLDVSVKNKLIHTSTVSASKRPKKTPKTTVCFVYKEPGI